VYAPSPRSAYRRGGVVTTTNTAASDKANQGSRRKWLCDPHWNPPIQRLLGNVSALQFVTVYSELGGDATPSPPSPSPVGNLVPDPGRRFQFRPRLSTSPLRNGRFWEVHQATQGSTPVFRSGLSGVSALRVLGVDAPHRLPGFNARRMRLWRLRQSRTRQTVHTSPSTR
jgi:hypothetical protein